MLYDHPFNILVRGTVSSLFSGFSDRYLRRFSVDQLKTYDTLINLPSNDWEIYYWIVGEY